VLFYSWAYKQAYRPEIKKPPEINDFRGFVVDYRFEISNLDLVDDLKEVVDFIEITSPATP
jgi:hypothetical protein